MLEKGTVVFGNWTVEERIGSGAFGTVYKIKREDFDEEYVAAMKVICIPQDGDEKGRLHSEGMNDTDISLYYKQIAKDFIKEIKLLSSLDGVTNIVDYKDHVIETNDDLGYTIYIKMQLLTPVNKLLVDESNNAKFLSNEDILKLGKDICSALEVCEKKRIIHRDIKIDNIFISEDGDYKLGDFGIARQLEATQGEMSKKGTLMYMAPEVFKGEKYDKTADIYSLGIVLYRLLNKNRAPFFPNYPDPIKFSDKETANARRLKGEVLPDIIGISAELNAVLKKACAFNPSDRYQSASELKAALELVETAVVAPVVVAPETSTVVEIEEDKTESVFAPAFVAVEPVTPVAGNIVDEDATVGVFNSAPIASAEPVAPIVEDTMEEEKTESVFANERDAILSDSFYEKETVTLESFDEEKTESVFDAAPVDTMEEDTFDDEKTESVFAPVVDKKKVESAASVKENTTKKSKSEGIIPIISVIVVIAIIAGICGIIRGNQVEEYIPQETDQETTQTTPTLNEEGYYEICSAEQLLWFADEVNSGRNPSANAILMNDIDLNPGYVFNSDGTVTYDGSYVSDGWINWEPIGFEWPSTSMHYFGTFDGNGYTVSGVYFNSDSQYAVGFFGYTENATIKNLNVTNAYISGYATLGGVVGYNHFSSILSCSFDGAVFSVNNTVGGVVGYNDDGTISFCTNTSEICGCDYIGGIVGQNIGLSVVASCTNSGSVNGENDVGGVVGYSSGTVESCTNGASVNGSNAVGGVVGWNYDTIKSCNNNGYVYGSNAVGGIVGYNSGAIDSSQNNAHIGSGTVGDVSVGCVVGYHNYGSITNTFYDTGSVDYGIAVIGYCDEHAKYNCTSHGVTETY